MWRLHKRTHRSASSRSGPGSAKGLRAANRRAWRQRNYQTKPNSGANPWGFKIDDAAEGRGRTPGTPSRMARRSQKRRATGAPSGLPRGDQGAGEKGKEIAKANPFRMSNLIVEITKRSQIPQADARVRKNR